MSLYDTVEENFGMEESGKGSEEGNKDSLDLSEKLVESTQHHNYDSLFDLRRANSFFMKKNEVLNIL